MGQPIPRRRLDADFAARTMRDMDGQPTQPLPRVANIAMKVPEITIFFWIIKVLTTGMGETTSDFLVHQMDPVIAVAIAGVCFFAALVLQLRARRYVPWIYWLAVVMVAIFGTMVADAIHIVLDVPYLISVIFFSIALASRLHRLVHQREDSLHPLNLYAPSRAILLDRDCHHLRARHRHR